MQYLVVVDTNVIISALLSKNWNASITQVLNALYDDKFTPIFNDEILAVVTPNELLEIIYNN